MTRITQIIADFYIISIICENPRYPRHLRSIETFSLYKQHLRLYLRKT
jgi:hypothetical protein